MLRAQSAAGSVIARKSGEEIRFVEKDGWSIVDLSQDVVNGDILRTNAAGQLAVLFSDRTQMRLGRNTSLLVKKVNGGGADASVELQSGTIWARAERGGSGLAIDTPAATAAIRGTDWTLSVDAGGKTSLTVLDGVVDLSNALGSVRVTKGEGAVAAIGQAPRKVIVLNSSDREQMLYYLELRDAFPFLPASPLPGPDMRRSRAALLALPPERRTAEDWLTLAEVNFTISGKAEALATLAAVRRQRLNTRQGARVALLDALIAGSERRYDEAAALFDRAAPNLDDARRSVALYGAYFASSLADPSHVERPPSVGVGAAAIVGEVFTVGFRDNLRATIDLLKGAEARYPNNALLPAIRAKVALVMGDREQAQAAIAVALARDPGQATALEARADFEAGVRGNLGGALADLQAALVSEPGNATIWNSLGLLQSARGAGREAETAFRKAIALDPMSPLHHANLAGLYLEEQRVEDARREIDRALEIEPGFDIALITRGRYYLQTGEKDKAIADLLAGSTANPAYAQGQLLLAAALYANGEQGAADQALDNADRLDPNDPVIAAYRTSIAIEDHDADGAIRNAQDYLKRSRQRGGDFGSVGANQEAGSVLNDAFRLQGLDAWGQFYGDIVFDPFASTSYLDQTVRGSVNPFANSFSYGVNTIDPSGNGSSYSSFLKALLLDPHLLAGSERQANLVRMPFTETALTTGINFTNTGSEWVKGGQIQGFTQTPFPISFFGNLSWEARDDERVGADGTDALSGTTDITGGNGYITASPTPDDHIVAYVNSGDNDSLVEADRRFLAGIPAESSSRDTNQQQSANFGIGWSHSFGYKNILNAAIFGSNIEGSSRAAGDFSLGGIPFGFERQQDLGEKSRIAAFGYTIGAEAATLRVGIEGGNVNATSRSISRLFFLNGDRTPGPLIEDVVSINDANVTTWISYIDALYDEIPGLRLEAALFARRMTGDTVDVARLEPRAGLAWEVAEGQWLRFGYLREGFTQSTPTLAPVGVVALQSNQLPLSIDGYADTLAARWDAQWTDRFFTAVDYQHQAVRNLLIADPLSLPVVDLVGGNVARGRIDRVSVTGNLALGSGVGLTATYARASSRNDDPTSGGYRDALTYVPRDAAQLALTFVNPIGIAATVAGNYTGRRASNLAGKTLGDYWTLDANVSWESSDGRVQLDLGGYNLTDEAFYVSAGTAGWARSVKAQMTVRF
ncbi:FecR domain-containing protein [Rhizobium sp. DKSPLA3]|uniref:FecR domain-containing protein n=1 Tax=Rhizobium quercicola TaxID=2901226 RepID=A0A9X1NX29_9HYPH|nr:FecR domain-containing protein [Rhizobium quercicola]MCD7111449.1 FecR domain-containing protein [Rhizobium quercicola]